MRVRIFKSQATLKKPRARISKSWATHKKALARIFRSRATCKKMQVQISFLWLLVFRGHKLGFALYLLNSGVNGTIFVRMVQKNSL